MAISRKRMNMNRNNRIAYPVLREEMAKKKITIMQISRDTGIDRWTVSKRLDGIFKLPFEMALEIKSRYFPEIEMEKLFKKEKPNI